MSAANALQHDQEFMKIPMPVRGIEYPRVPSPPPSEHSSQDQDEVHNDKQPDDPLRKKKKTRKTLAEYIKLRNDSYKTYLKRLEKYPPITYCMQIARLRRKRGGRINFKPVKRRPFPDDVSVNFSDTSCETNCSVPRNHGRARDSIKKKSEIAVVNQRKQQIMFNKALSNGVLFSHVNFRMILEAKWTLIKVTRLEQIFEGVKLDCTVDLKWLEFEKDIQKYYGPMDTDSEHFKQLFVEFQMQRWEMIIDMFEEETKMMEKMLEQKKVPSDFPEKLLALRKTRSRLETKIAAMYELQCDQNPYTNPDNMDFWVMPRPKQTIKVYGIHHEEMEDFLDFNLAANEHGDEPKMALEKQKLFVREGYNPAVFDVGWKYAVEKVYGDVPWKEFFPDDFGDFDVGTQREKEKCWGNHLLEIRGYLMKFNPFGVQDTYLFKHIKNKYCYPEHDPLLGNYEDPVEDYLSDLAFTQKLISSSDMDGDTVVTKKNILFDSLFEGVIVTPAEMLDRVRTRIRFLIDEQPNRLLPVNELQEIYENCFDQKFFPLQWGYEDMEDFLKKEVVKEDVIIVEKDEREVEEELQKNKAGANAEIPKEIAAKWASILDNNNNDDDEEDDFDYSDLFEELINEGPWII